MRCIDRDGNAFVNILYIVSYWIELHLYLVKSQDIHDIEKYSMIKNDVCLQNFIKNDITFEEKKSSC
jgi:hypothetical protein